MSPKNKPAASANAAGSGDRLRLRAKPRQSRPVSGRDQRAELLRAALEYAERGLRPVPMVALAKRPALKGWRERASCDPQAVQALFADAPRADGLAIATGEGVFVVDLDRNHTRGVDGLLSFAALVAKHGAGETLALGPRVRTPRKGVHAYFRCDPGRVVRNRVGLTSGVDVRGDGGLALAPPSPGYCSAFASCALELPEAPAWLLALVDPPSPATAHASPLGLVEGRPLIRSPSAYVRAVLERELSAVANAKLGVRNQTLYKASARVGSLVAAAMLALEPLEAALYEAAVACGLVADDGEAAARATVANGLKRGLANPRVCK